ncbi:hypothetical protein ACVIHI_008903 [Bradyrhizobium sp. USDA 4524]|nr:hypothetical protein [Bradyrhizobium sp. USDA 4538]MCP1907048.1 hypothetical protein [Bradyrhizobium sp. USDA 4537]MCP1985524.1 hypothetical protein [Bradyrhizobium sp. USDA 4539]
MPLGNGQLGGNQGRFAPIALFEDFEEIKALLIIEGVGAPVVEDEQIDAAERPQEPRVAAVAARQSEIGEQPRDTLIEHGAIVAAGRVAERRGEPALADAGRTRDIVPKNIRSKLSFNIDIIHALVSASLL